MVGVERGKDADALTSVGEILGGPTRCRDPSPVEVGEGGLDGPHDIEMAT
jgi:hypothetical protein